jgi:hypothetical protein
MESFSEIYTRSAAPKRIALNVARGERSRHQSARHAAADFVGDAFRELATKYIITGLERGVPSLFVDVKPLYSDAEKMVVVGEIIEEVVTKLEAESGLHGDGK